MCGVLGGMFKCVWCVFVWYLCVCVWCVYLCVVWEFCVCLWWVYVCVLCGVWRVMCVGFGECVVCVCML